MKRPSSSTMADSSELPPPAPPNNQKKKTRELPNLSDCQCCNVRINCTNPKNRLQILASEWRIVLLCKCCYNLVESSKYCSYCLTRVSCSSMESCYECKRCHRRIHKHCVSMFSFGSVNNGGNSDEFSVCFDCWIPKLVEYDYNARVLDNRSRRKGGKVCGESMLNSLGSSGVCNLQEKGKAVEGTVNDACAVARKKVVVAVEAKEKALDKEMDARRAVVLASSAVGLVGVEKDGDQRGLVVDDDAQLAIRLHRAMNSSPRISRNTCLLNTHCVDVPEVNGLFDGFDSRAAIETSYSGRPMNGRGDERIGLSETRQEYEHQCAREQDDKHIGDSGGALITYCRKGRKPLEVKCKEEPDCFPCSSNGGWSSGDISSKEEPECSLRTYRRRLKKANLCKLELGHCYKTYSRRHSVIPNVKGNSIYGNCNLENGIHDQAISLRCCEESRASTNAS